MKYQTKAIEVEAVQYQKDMGLEDGYAVYETEYPEDGHTFELSENVDTTRQTIIQAAVQTPAWKVVSEGEWIVTYPDGLKEIWGDMEFKERFTSDESPVRPQVKWFAEKMEETLKANDHKGGWDNCNTLWLISRLREEVDELEGSCVNEKVIKEATDVANFAMMIADRLR